MNQNDTNNNGLIPSNGGEYSSLGFFNNGEHFLVTFKKTEKIVQAVYLVTQHIKDIEPLKSELREYALSLLATAFSMNSAESYDQNSLIVSYFSSAFRINSLFTVAYSSGLISYSNARLLQNELESLTDFLKGKILDHTSKSGFVLSKDFFATDVQDVGSKGQIVSSRSASLPGIENSKAIQKDTIKDKKNSRQENILNLLKKKSDLTIKDFVEVISDCSEKTIQRELIDLVNKGIIRKEGERRWSRYSLK